MESRIFCGQRSLGYVCNDIPLQIRYVKKHRDTFIITVVGKRFYTYSAAKLHLYSISEFHPSDIVALAVDPRFVYTACQEDVRIFKRGVEPDFIHSVPNVRHILPFGELVVAVAENTLIVFARESGERYLEVPFAESSFKITCLIHPVTYLNKILIGSQQGTLQLWNINSAAKVYEFSGWGKSVACLEQSPALDVVAIGLEGGGIVLHNLKKDITMMTFRQEWGTVTGITFRTDGPSFMITSSNLGHLGVWNLETRLPVAQKENAHADAITGLKCFPSEQIFATSSPDNSLRLWIMDDNVAGMRLLMFKEGHAEPPNRIRFYGDEGSVILSAEKSIRSNHLQVDMLSFSLGRASFNKKAAKKKGVARDENVMPPIVEFAAETTREGGWESEGEHGKEQANIVAIHEGVRQVTTWSYGRKTKCSFRFLHPRFVKNTKVLPTCVAITVCGNFCLIGYNTGHVDRYNLQSGIHRQAYGNPAAHEFMVSAVSSDSLNEQVYTCGGEKEMKFWNFRTGKTIATLTLSSTVTSMLTYRENAMAVVALSDFSLQVIDMDIRRVTRTFVGHKASITDMAFSPDCRWLVSASADCSIRVWDLSSASLIDCFRTLTPCVSLSFSPTGEYLATAHEKDVGIFLWTNKTIYSPTTLTAIAPDSEPELLRLPGGTSQSGEIIPVEDEEMPIDITYTSPAQLADHLLTLSLLPEYRWKNLAQQDLIRERNKPREALKLPEKVPFFLPTIPGLDGLKFDLSQKEDSASHSTNKLNKHNLIKLLHNNSAFYEALMKEDSVTPFEILAELSPSAVETEMRMLSPDSGGSVEALESFLRCACVAVEDGRNQELTQSYVDLFFKLHGTYLADEGVSENVVELVIELKGKVKESATSMENLLDQSLNVVLFLKHVAL